MVGIIGSSAEMRSAKSCLALSIHRALSVIAASKFKYFFDIISSTAFDPGFGLPEADPKLVPG